MAFRSTDLRASIEDRPPRGFEAPHHQGECGAADRSAKRKQDPASMSEPIISAVETVLDNGKFGTRTVKF